MNEAHVSHYCQNTPSPFAKIGAEVYVVTAVDHATFRTVCPVCGDTKQLNVNGFEIPCSFCTDTHHTSDNDRPAITVHRYSVCVYQVYEITVSGTCRKASYTRIKNGNATPSDYPAVTSIWAFMPAVTGREQDAHKRKVPCYPDDPYEFPSRIRLHMGWSGCYGTKTEAEVVCRALNMREKNVLRDFNEKFGNNHSYPWHDLKEEKSRVSCSQNIPSAVQTSRG